MILTRANLHFALHFVEMIVAMFVGMFALAPLWELAAPGLPERPDVQALVMATDMAAGMAAWMAVRRHSWPRILEMSAVMYVPFAVMLVPFLARLGLRPRRDDGRPRADGSAHARRDAVAARGIQPHPPSPLTYAMVSCTHVGIRHIVCWARPPSRTTGAAPLRRRRRPGQRLARSLFGLIRRD